MASRPSPAARPTQAVPLFAGCILLVLGVALLLDNLGAIALRTSDLFPLLIVAVGVGAVALGISALLPSRR